MIKEEIQYAIIVVSVFIIIILAKSCQSQETKPKPLHEHPTLVSMLKENNRLRKIKGKPPHKINLKLCKAAQNHADYMAGGGKFSHYSNRGYIQRAKDQGYTGGVRENIAMGHRSVKHVFNTWYNSDGHYASIMSDTINVGFGYQINNNKTYWVAVYGYPEKAK